MEGQFNLVVKDIQDSGLLYSNSSQPRSPYAFISQTHWDVRNVESPQLKRIPLAYAVLYVCCLHWRMAHHWILSLQRLNNSRILQWKFSINTTVLFQDQDWAAVHVQSLAIAFLVEKTTQKALGFLCDFRVTNLSVTLKPVKCIVQRLIALQVEGTLAET